MNLADGHARRGAPGGATAAGTMPRAWAAAVTDEGGSPFEVGLLLRRAHDIAAAELAHVLTPYGLGLRHFAVMLALAERGPMSQRELVDALGKDGSSMVRAVDDLEQAGLAERRAVPTDRRRYSVELTDAGIATYESAHRNAGPIADELSRRLPPGDIAFLVRLLRAFCRNQTDDPDPRGT